MKVQSFQESEPLKGSGSWSLGLAELPNLTSLLRACANCWALEAVSLDVSMLGSMCVEVGCMEDIGAGVGGCVADWAAGVKLPDGSRRVKTFSNPACCEFCVVQGRKQVIGQDVRIYCYE